MPCPTCSHSVKLVACLGAIRIFWCPRCGTLLEVEQTDLDGEPQAGREVRSSVPKLVKRCREYREEIGSYHYEAWHRLGIEEAILPPEQRT